MRTIRPEIAGERRLSVLASVLLFFAAACATSTPADADGGSGSADAGDQPDGGAGVQDGGSTLALQIEANPNNVLSGVASVSWPAHVAAISVTYQLVNGTGVALTTPTTTPGANATQASLPVLGLAASSTYRMQATGRDSSGNALRSALVSFTTGALPAAVPSFHTTGTTTGYTLLAKVGDTGSAPEYLTIVDPTGTPVWYVPVIGGLVADFQRQPDGTYTVASRDPANTITGLLGITASVFLQDDVLGNVLRSWTARNVTATDGHELRLQPNGDVLLFGLEERTADLSASGGRTNATLVGDILQRVTPGGQVTFSWNVFDHISPAHIVAPVDKTGALVDFTHANAIDVMADGNYLISLRNISQVLKINAQTGEVIWKLGGADGDFQFVNDPLHGFSMQHGARELPNGHILMFDNGTEHTPPQSRAVEYSLDTRARTATLVWFAEDNPALFASAMGYAQRLMNGHTLICYGTLSRVQEVDAQGNVVWELTDPNPGFGIYRAYRLDSLY